MRSRRLAGNTPISRTRRFDKNNPRHTGGDYYSSIVVNLYINYFFFMAVTGTLASTTSRMGSPIQIFPFRVPPVGVRELTGDGR
jgi:hypothetical protein